MRRFLKYFGIVALCILAAFLLLYWLYWYFFVDMSRLPEGEFLRSYKSPNGEYVVNIYIVREDAGRRYSAIRGELVGKGMKKNIYWNYGSSRYAVYWKSDDVVCINSVDINIHNDVYDWRRPVAPDVASKSDMQAWSALLT